MFAVDRTIWYYDSICAEETNYLDEAFDIEIAEDAVNLANGLFNIFQDLIDEEDKLEESFVSRYGAINHFNKHCLGNRRVKSSRTNVYYDFTRLADYLSYEAELNKSSKSRNTIFIKDLLLDIATDTIRAFHKFFECGKYLVFGLGNGFANSLGTVKLCLHSYATKYTTNYPQNTIDFLILTPNGDTITMYPIDANYLGMKINNEISKVPRLSNLKNLQINH